MQQIRNYCKECKREWLQGKYVSNNSRMTITGNPDNGTNCIFCGSQYTSTVMYDNAPGFDIPRDSSSVITLPKAEVIEILGREYIRSEIPRPLQAVMETNEGNRINDSKD